MEEAQNDQVLMVFIKNPVLGKVKTRLSKTIGNLNALKVYRYLLNHTRDIAENLESTDRMVYYDEFIPIDDEWKTSLFQKYRQGSGDLGEKMSNAFKKAFDLGYDRVVLISPDCPKMGSNTIQNAYRKLDTNDYVIGPTRDGGFYLIGMKKHTPELFKDKAWSTETVFPDTIKDLDKMKAKYAVLAELVDVDREEDLDSIKRLKIY